MSSLVHTEITDRIRFKIRVLKEMKEEFEAEKESALKTARKEAANGGIPYMGAERAAYASVRWATGKIEAYEQAMEIVARAFDDEARRQQNAENNRIMKESA